MSQVVYQWAAARAVDMTGRTINGCLVLERAPSINQSARWRVVASCGHEVLLTRRELRCRELYSYRPYRCTACRASAVPAIPENKKCPRCDTVKSSNEFYRRSGRKGKPLLSWCKACCKLKQEPTRAADSIECHRCFDQPWRRPVGGCACGGAWEEEDMRTARYLIMTGNSGRDSVLPDWEV